VLARKAPAGGGTEPADPTLMFVPDERPDE
jgi:hypothetical protein